MKISIQYNRQKTLVRNLFWLCSMVAAGVRCSSPPREPPIDTSVFTLPKCTSDGFLSFEDIKPKAGIDYVEFRRKVSATDDQMIGSIGTKCATATNVQACTDEFAKFFKGTLQECLPQSYFKAPTPYENKFPCYYFRVTKENSFYTVYSRNAFIESILPIDNAQEAALLAWSFGDDISCTDRSRGGVRIVEDGYEVLTTRGAECGYVIRYVHKVKKDGSIEIKQSEIIKTPDPNCPYTMPLE